VVITYRYGCVAVMAEQSGGETFVGRLPEIDAVSPLGWTDAVIAGYAVRMLDGEPPAACLRFGLGCGAANLIGYGAGVFSPGEAQRFAGLVELEEVRTEA
jgi:fructose-1-phosphate kinase PfkB-like protein